MKLGLNLSFATKRWQDPEELAELCKNIDVKHFQFNLDFIDPWWPSKTRNALANAYSRSFTKRNIQFDSVFGGLAAYSYPQLLAPTKELRDLSVTFFKRAIDTTIELGATIFGTPLGGMTNQDAYDAQRREEIYKETIDNLYLLGEYAKKSGISEIQIESTPLETEFPNNVESSLRLMEDLAKEMPNFYKILIDWGHALYKPLLGDRADMNVWINSLHPYLGDMHLQQTDGFADCHWDFTNPNGILTLEVIKQIIIDNDVEDKIQFLEIEPAFEEKDSDVLSKVNDSISILRQIFDE